MRCDVYHIDYMIKVDLCLQNVVWVTLITIFEKYETAQNSKLAISENMGPSQFSVFEK